VDSAAGGFAGLLRGDDFPALAAIRRTPPLLRQRIARPWSRSKASITAAGAQPAKQCKSTRPSRPVPIESDGSLSSCDGQRPIH
jgi:hypothetical protein